MRLPAPDRRSVLSVARRILGAPTAPYHEHRVRALLREILRGAGVRTRIDAYGNLVARYRSGRASPLSLAAHMDHPGCEIIRARGAKAEARWNGQVPTFDLRGLRLAVWSDGPAGRRGIARVLSGDGRLPTARGGGAPSHKSSDGRTDAERARRLTLRVPPGTRPGDFGYADLVPFRLSGNRIISKALDNVGGCAAIAATLLHLARRRLPADVVALFTRAEETGFHGAAGAIRASSVPRSRPLIVLECSKEIPGAEMGCGPVIRVGDRLRVFDPDLIGACEETAEALRRLRKTFRYQRRLMDGGTCESSLFQLSGYRTACFAFPLGNYHNIGRHGIAAEYIDQRDFLGGVDCLAAFASLGVDPAGSRRRLRTRLRERIGSQARLKTG